MLMCYHPFKKRSALAKQYMKNKLRCFIAVWAWTVNFNSVAQKFTIKGVVKDSASGELSVGALVFIKVTNKEITTNAYGCYSITLDKGTPLNLRFKVLTG